MAIPDYQTAMLPVLQFLADGKEHHIGEVVEAVAQQFHLSAEEREQLLGSGQQTVIRNRVGWARTYLKKAGLIESSRRAYFHIAERGRSVLAKNPTRIDVKFLEQFPEFVAFRDLRREQVDDKPQALAPGAEATPEEALDAAYQRLRIDLESELLDQVKTASPAFFERPAPRDCAAVQGERRFHGAIGRYDAALHNDRGRYFHGAGRDCRPAILTRCRKCRSITPSRASP